ncbi:MAG: peptidyl-tRNA hydrolase Pth2 [Thermoplasmata archaeon]
MEFDYKMVIVVRKDLKLSPGKLAVQASHASVLCAVESEKQGKYFDKWFREGQKKVIVKCDDLEHMEFLRDVARNNGLTARMVADAGLTEIPPGTKTCLGVGPGPNEIVDKVTGNLPLL